MTTREPNLFLVGSMRSGTTAFHELLGSHPQIFMSDFKEPAFFTDPEELAADSRIVFEAGYAGNLEQYLDLFSTATNETYLGESSTHYTKAPRINGVPNRIAQMAPDARILYLVRNPVDRAISHYRFAVKRKTERADPLRAFQDDPFYVSVSNYAMQVRPYLERFGTHQVQIVVFEELALDPSSVMSQVTTWLGLKPFENPKLPVRNAVPSHLSKARGPRSLHNLGHSHRYRQIAGRWIPKRVRNLVRGALTEPLEQLEELSDQVVDYLHTALTPSIDELARLSGRDYELWSKPSATGSSATNQ